MVVNISFEGGLHKAFEDEKILLNKFLKLMFQSIKDDILSFIGMLRKKYLAREVEEDYTFKSVILVGL